jgi:ribosome maturation factor RimP
LPAFFIMNKKNISPEAEELGHQLSAQLAPIVKDHGAILVDVEIAGSKSQPSIRILVHKDPAISLAACEQISREVADYLDVEDPLPGRYRLEVTSPGLDRPLVTDGDFTRAKGYLLKVVLLSGKNHRGRLIDWDATQIALGEDGEEVENVLREEIAKAIIEVEFKNK